MGILTRVRQKIFGDAGGSGEFGKIGSKAAGSPVTTKNLETIQELSQYDLGMNAIVSDQGTSVLPYLEDINSLFLLTTSQIAYLMQSGVPEWNDETEYYLGVSIVLENGMLWIDTYGTGGTPNLNFQPSTNPSKWKPAASPERVEFETSKDLVFNVDNNTQATATCSRMSLLDSNFIPRYINNLNVTWDITTDREAGTSEKPSTNYGAWVDSDLNLVLAPDLESVADSFTSGELRDSGATFLTDLVHAGDIVYNLDDKTKTTVTSDATVQGIVVLDDNIFPGGDENYKIVKMSPVGLGENRERIGAVFNNSGSNLDDSTYTQIQPKKTYSEAAGDFTVTESGWTTDTAEQTIEQENDWTGEGQWTSYLNINGAIVPDGSPDLTFTGLIFKTNLTQSILQHSHNGPVSSPQTATSNATGAWATGGIILNGSNPIARSAHIYKGKMLLDKKPPFHN
jgi:hypothetical protein